MTAPCSAHSTHEYVTADSSTEAHAQWLTLQQAGSGVKQAEQTPELRGRVGHLHIHSDKPCSRHVC